MAEDRPRKPTISSPVTKAPEPLARGMETARGGGGIPRDVRAPVVVPIRYKYENIIEFIDTQSMNISKTGMFVVTNEPLPLATILDFEIGLADGFCLLKGKAEVVRVSNTPPKGLGIKFALLDAPSQKLIARIVEVNIQEGKKPTVSMDFAPAETPSATRGFASSGSSASAGVAWKENEVAIQLNPATVSYFVYNPLLNIRLGGFVVPSDREVPLGTIFAVTINSVDGDSLFAGRGKVVAKHEKRLGIRLSDVDKTVLSRLQAEVHRLAASNK